MEQFTPFASLAGGALIGLSATIVLASHGKIAGMSGLLGGLVTPRSGDVVWRGSFVLGLVAGGAILAAISRPLVAFGLVRSAVALVVAGVLTGVGTRLAGGCTSGHGVCGNARLSKRSMVATVTFVATGAATVLVVERVLGGVV